jgi:transcription antitermination factor NusG
MRAKKPIKEKKCENKNINIVQTMSGKEQRIKKNMGKLKIIYFKSDFINNLLSWSNYAN